MVANVTLLVFEWSVIETYNSKKLVMIRTVRNKKYFRLPKMITQALSIFSNHLIALGKKN